MQRYCVKLRKHHVDILNDHVSEAIKAATTVGYMLDDSTIEQQYDFIIASAHDPNAFSHKKYGKLILVVSHVPVMNSDSWAGFYVNLCMADVIACDSFVKKQLTTFTYPEKRIINLDGCSPVSKKPVIIQTNSKIKLTSLDVDKSVWEKLCAHIISSIEWSKKFDISLEQANRSVGISFYPIGNVLATAMVHKHRFISVAYDEESSVYLDARCNNRVAKEIGGMLHVSGGGSTQRIKEVFDIFLEELITLMDHTESGNNPLFKFTSNANIYDRIFYEVNRSLTR